MSKKAKTNVVTEPTPERPVLAVLESGEIAKLSELTRIINDAGMRYNLLVEGGKAVAQEIQKKYGLPEHYEVDTANGNVFAKE